MTPHPTDDLPDVGSLEQLYPVLAGLRMTAGWHKKRASLWREPRTEHQPRHWRYALGAHALAQAPVYLVLGIVWLLPLRRFLIWMETGRTR